MKRLFAALFALIAYGSFFLSFNYLIAFLGDFWVPKTVNSGIQGDLMTSVLINVFLLGLFSIQHSIMARPSFKNWIKQFVPESVERSLFVLASSMCLVLIFLFWQPINIVIWHVESAILKYAICTLFFTGWAIVYISSFLINHFHLFGLEQVYNYIRRRPEKEMKFQKIFLYKVVRHPLMLGLLIAFWSVPTMTIGHLLFVSVWTAYVYLAVKHLEERDLRKELGEQYAKYQQEVPMLIPGVK